MRRAACIGVAVVVGLLTACSDDGGAGGGGADEGPNWAIATATIDGRSYEVSGVTLDLEFGDGAFYNLSGQPVEQPDVDCVEGLSGGLYLYGDLPTTASAPDALIGQPLPVEFSGDGDDANLCFVGTGGLLGAENATVTITSIAGERARFTMSGEFQRYDEEGNPTPTQAQVSGTARVDTSAG